MAEVHPRRPFRRVVLKLGGEMFGGGEVGVDPDVVSTVADQIADVAADGVQVAVVIGGGNFFRGAELHERGMDRGEKPAQCSIRQLRGYGRGRQR